MREPIREDCLWAFVLPDIQNTLIMVLPYVADHKGLPAKLLCTEVLEPEFEREVWPLGMEDWDTLEGALRATEWRVLCEGTAEDALSHFQEILWC